jgi:hypothetical protein
MIALFCLFLALFASPFKSKSRLEAENASLTCARSKQFDPFDPCPYRKSNPDVLMVQTSEVWGWHDTANGLHSTRRWCILVQR